MGSMIELALGRLEVDWGKNSAHTHHGQLFENDNLQDIPYYYAGDDWPDDDPIIEHKEGFAKPLRDIKDRLELLGFTLEYARYEYDTLHRWHELDEQPIPFDVLAEALATVNVNEVSANYGEDFDPGKFVRREIIDRLSEHSDIDIKGPRADHWEIDLLLENFSVYSALRLLAENPKNLDLDVCWSFMDVVENGWVDRSEFQAGALPKQRYLVVTEGSSDAKVLRHALYLLRPHLADFFQFVDMSEGYPFSGTGELFRFTQGLTSIGIQNRTVILYDNDAEGVAKFEKTQCLSLPKNVSVMKLPDLEALKAFETIGPNGRAVSDINGKAASIECYLDTSYKRREAPIVRWTAFNRDTGVYQGEIEGKTGIVKSFLKLRRVPDNYDLIGIEACLDELVSQCIMIAERLDLPPFSGPPVSRVCSPFVCHHSAA